VREDQLVRTRYPPIRPGLYGLICSWTCAARRRVLGICIGSLKMKEPISCLDQIHMRVMTKCPELEPLGGPALPVVSMPRDQCETASRCDANASVTLSGVHSSFSSATSIRQQQSDLKRDVAGVAIGTAARYSAQVMEGRGAD